MAAVTTAIGDVWNGRGKVAQEQAVFAVGALLILVHTVDDSIAAGEIDIAPGVISLIALVVAAAYRVLPWIVIVAAALFVGITRLIGGVLHLVSLTDPQPGDYTGIFEALGAIAVLLVGVGVVRRVIARRRSATTTASGS